MNVTHYVWAAEVMQERLLPDMNRDNNGSFRNFRLNGETAEIPDLVALGNEHKWLSHQSSFHLDHTSGCSRE